MNRYLKRLIRCCLAVGVVVFAQSRGDAQTTSNWANTDPGGGDWVDFNNWEGLLVPQANFDESANIGNGGTAFVAGPVSSPAGITIPNGTVEIRNGGTLTSTPGSSAGNGAVVVGQGSNESHLRVLGGGSFTAPILTVNAGSADTSVQLSGNGSLTVSGNATLGRTTRITGNAATFNVGGDLTIGGNFISEITDPNTHTAINVVGGVTIDSGAILNLDFNGVTPTSGNSWTLFSGSTGLSGNFGSVTGPAVGNGFGYKLDTSGGNVSIAVSPLMKLTVDRQTGAASISSPADAIDLKLYSIRSPGGYLTPSTWDSFEDSGFDGGNWIQGLPNGGNPNGLAEAHNNPPLGATTFSAGQSQPIGTIWDNSVSAFGENREDLALTYLEPGSGTAVNGIVEYTGNHNNLVMVVDPTTGEAVIQNQSPFDAVIKLYSVGSAAGSLAFDASETVSVGWDSFDEQNLAGSGWLRGNGSGNLIVEANQVGSALQISSGAAFDIGEPFNIGGTEDLLFEFLLDGASQRMAGVVEYGSIPIPFPDGDYDASGQVALGDLNLVLFNWSQDGGGLPAGWVNQRPDPGMTVGLTELNGVLFNWGNTSSIATVPEPASMALVWIALFAACSPGWKHRR